MGPRGSARHGCQVERRDVGQGIGGPGRQRGEGEGGSWRRARGALTDPRPPSAHRPQLVNYDGTREKQGTRREGTTVSHAQNSHI